MSPTLDQLAKVSLVFGLSLTLYFAVHPEAEVFEKPANGQISQKLDTPWRYTNMGWQDSSNWKSRTRYAKPAAARVHPFLWTALITLAALGILIWSSEEELHPFARTGPKPVSNALKRRHGASCDCVPQCKNFCLQDLLSEGQSG